MIDRDLDYYSKEIRSRIFSAYRGVPWTPEQRKIIQPLLRTQLEELIHKVLENFGNVGGVIPDNPGGVVGYSIRAVHWEAAVASEEEYPDISVNEMDYSDMWLDYLYEKGSALFTNVDTHEGQRPKGEHDRPYKADG